MKTRFLIIIGVIIVAGIIFLLSFSIEKDDESYVLFCNHWVFSDYKTCKVLWREHVPEPTKTVNMSLVITPAPKEFLRMDCEDLYMYQEPPSQDVADAWSTRLHECQNDQEKLPVLIELERWRQISCLDILDNTMLKFENVVSQQAFDIRHNQCVEITEHNLDEPTNEK